jgi:hypothetical protein
MCFGIPAAADDELEAPDITGRAPALPATPNATTAIAPAIAVPAMIDVIRFFIAYVLSISTWGSSRTVILHLLGKKLMKER